MRKKEKTSDCAMSCLVGLWLSFRGFPRPPREQPRPKEKGTTVSAALPSMIRDKDFSLLV